MRKRHHTFFTVTASAYTREEEKAILLFARTRFLKKTSEGYELRATFSTFSDAVVFCLTYANLYFITSDRSIDDAHRSLVANSSCKLGELKLSINREKQQIYSPYQLALK